MVKYWYLSVPIAHPDPKIVKQRCKIATKLCGDFWDAQIYVFSPATHSLALRNHGRLKSTTHRELLDFDLAVLKGAAGMYVLMLPGWEESKGVQEEITFARNNKIPIIYWVEAWL